MPGGCRPDGHSSNRIESIIQAVPHSKELAWPRVTYNISESLPNRLAIVAIDPELASGTSHFQGLSQVPFASILGRDLFLLDIGIGLDQRPEIVE